MRRPSQPGAVRDVYAWSMSLRESRYARIALGLLTIAAVAVVMRRLIHRVGSRTRADAPRPPLIRGPVTQSISPSNPADVDLDTPGRNTEQRLDEALQETFPASDPIAMHIE